MSKGKNGMNWDKKENYDGERGRKYFHKQLIEYKNKEKETEKKQENTIL